MCKTRNRASHICRLLATCIYIYISHFKNRASHICKILLLDYSVYLQNCKATGSPTLLSTSGVCLKIGLSKYI